MGDGLPKKLALKTNISYNASNRKQQEGAVSVTVYINLKQLKKRKGHIASCPCELKKKPETLRQLIAMLASDGARAYNERLRQKDEMRALSQEDMDDMSRIGKIGFGLPFGSREADPDEAVRTAMEGLEDGLFRVFINEREPEDPDAPLDLQEGDNVTIIRLVMLTGGFF